MYALLYICHLFQVMENLKYIEGQLKGNKFFGRETIGYTDIAFGWMTNLLSVFKKVTEIKLLDEEKFPLLSAWLQNFSDVLLIKENWPPRDKLVIKFQAIREKCLAAGTEGPK
ncbi:hypothetical protein LOK49_LG03G03457 [Camellia lanceoleosa]|uniref:Uncharacterized protein n=1 Tax=Camellia lanceoleosa TaxID=1840588 RepID=A0ACC0IDC6_9ERIC|nr:hypothetical protein LOK49_LG03G03457 [Camellia lanceoleosa]